MKKKYEKDKRRRDMVVRKLVAYRERPLNRTLRGIRNLKP
jgi:hypothetical protein